ncbi:hypothetical protein ZOSMA_78G00870 [Zostera marina]|uniref:Uncharacterized protein n=1 Tax=Zostera marina TaxID=29655 RepID=A0A0K9NNH4_ZOSMR|nr:hypothetical protein ZOSMA_78G00870 [Zostera marina]
MEEVRFAENVSGQLSDVHRFDFVDDNVVGFSHNILWEEPWMIALTSFHITFIVLAMRYRRDIKFQLWLCVGAIFCLFFSKEIWILITSFGADKHFMNRNSIERYWTRPIMITWTFLMASSSSITFNFNLPL